MVTEHPLAAKRQASVPVWMRACESARGGAEPTQAGAGIVEQESTTHREGWPATVGRRAGRWPVQLRFATQGITGEDYVTSKPVAACKACALPPAPAGRLRVCRPWHLQRVNPPGTRIRRWYCSLAGVTFSALPDCLCARLSGTVQELERGGAVGGKVLVARGGRCAKCAARLSCPACCASLAGGCATFIGRCRAIKGLYRKTFAAALPTVTDFARVLGVDGGNVHRLGIESVLVHLRQIASQHLAALPAPLGFNPVQTGVRNSAGLLANTEWGLTRRSFSSRLAHPLGNRPGGRAPRPEDADR